MTRGARPRHRWFRLRRRHGRVFAKRAHCRDESIIALSDDAIIGNSDAGIITDWNQGAEAMFGYASEDAIGQPVTLLEAPDQPDFLQGVLLRLRRGVAIRRLETVLRHRNGTLLTVMLTATPVYDQDRNSLGISILLRDVTLLRRAAQDLADVQARLAVLQNQMTHLSRLAAMEQMAVTLAHELNQPLAAIVNYVRAGQRLLASEAAPDLERLGTALEGSMTQSLRAGQIIGRLRAFVARGESDKRVEVVAGLVEEAVSLAMPEAGQRDVHLSVALDPTARLILADRVQVQQVLVNLIRNATEAMQDSPRRDLSIASRWLDDMVEISVADTGPGIPEAVREHLFEPFVTTRRHGTGLGLMICHAIVMAHSGTLTWQAAPGGGTIFRFTVTGVAEAVP